jgi:UDP-N-acetylmuramoyl-tripeptide--D-alanyl-D-alanine ligase
MNIISDILYPQYVKSHAVTTDSRSITPGCIFFAFKGATFDGNAFAGQALQQGAALCVVSDPAAKVDDRCLLVDDVLATLQDLARHHRMQMNIPVIGVTGTNGKTTTKELMKAVLSRRYRTHATTGNLNNHLGVPLTLLSTPPEAEIVIVEMGASHPGEIDMLCGIAQPTVGLITTVGKAHLEGFGSFEGVVQTKTELYRFLASVQGTAFVNEDNEILMDKAMELSTLPDQPSQVPGYIPGMPTQFNGMGGRPVLSVVTYGSAESAEVKGALVSANPYMKFYFENEDQVYSVQTQLLGGYNFTNAMAAVCVGRYFDVELFDIKEALEQYTPNNNRSQYKRTQHNEVILDCYNANPSSMTVAIDNLLSMPQQHKWVCLGSMKELGTDSHKEHEAIVRRLHESHLQGVLLVGEEFRFASDHVLWFATSGEAKQYLQEHPITDALILLKGSNATRMWALEDVL